MEDFWGAAKPNGDCLEWQRSKSIGGYGQIRYKGRREGAHRVAYELTHGPIPDGMFVLHYCDNPSCINPKHLWVGTAKENTHDMLAKGRHQNADSKGEKNGRSKLTDEDVRWIRDLAHLGPKRLGQIFGVYRSSISKIVSRETWRHIP